MGRIDITPYLDKDIKKDISKAVIVIEGKNKFIDVKFNDRLTQEEKVRYSSTIGINILKSMDLDSGFGKKFNGISIRILD